MTRLVPRSRTRLVASVFFVAACGSNRANPPPAPAPIQAEVPHEASTVPVPPPPGPELLPDVPQSNIAPARERVAQAPGDAGIGAPIRPIAPVATDAGVADAGRVGAPDAGLDAGLGMARDAGVRDAR